MHGPRPCHIWRNRTHLRQQSLRWARKRCPSYVRSLESNSRLYATASPLQRPSPARNILLFSTIFLGAGLGYFYVTDTRASVHRWLAVPLIRAIWPDAEDAHEAGVHLLKELYRFGLHPRERGRPDDAKDLETEVFGHTLVNPLGISSGLDKHGEIPTQLLALGPAIVEIGGVTESKQSGNPKPRVFRIATQQGMVNRYGLNSDGSKIVAARLRHRVRKFAYDQGYGLGEDAERFVLDGDAGVPPGSLAKGKLLAVQIAKNESTADGDIEAIRKDYVGAARLLAKYADIIVVNVSCPNAPGYRELQQVQPLTKILTGVVDAASSINRKSKPAVMVKVSPDEDTEQQIESICAAVWKSGVDGVVVGNTTKSRPEPLPKGTTLSKAETAIMEERGGYSGPQLFNRTVSLVGKYRRILDYPLHKHDESPQPHLQYLKQSSMSETSAQSGTLTPKVIFCTGGITNGQRALEVLNAGASVAQIYTGRFSSKFQALSAD